MFKKEIIWREILTRAIEKKQFEFTQSELARKYGFSLSTVFNALKIPRAQGAIKVAGKNFSVVDVEKLLYIWATQRNLAHELVYQTAASKSAKEIEGLMPAGIIYGAYSAYSQKYSEAPADYDKVYVYAGGEELTEIKKRFPQAKGKENVFVLKKDLFTPLEKATNSVGDKDIEIADGSMTRLSSRREASVLMGFTEPNRRVTADAQTFVDLWNLSDWYAKDFLEKLKEKIL